MHRSFAHVHHRAAELDPRVAEAYLRAAEVHSTAVYLKPRCCRAKLGAAKVNRTTIYPHHRVGDDNHRTEDPHHDDRGRAR